MNRSFALLITVAAAAGVVGSCASGRADDRTAAGKPFKILSGRPRLIVVNGYSTSFRWPKILQRKLDRFFDSKRVIEVVSATRGGTPVARWIDVKTGRPLAAWSRVTDALKRKGDRPAIVLAQQSLQWAFGGRTTGIRGPKDAERIRQGADILEKYVRLFLKDGADLVFVGMHIYKHPMEPEIGNERLALAELAGRKIPNFHAGPDVWTPTKGVYPRGFARDRVHPGDIANEIMAQLWFETLLKHDRLDVPAWSRKEMQQAVGAGRPATKAPPSPAQPGRAKEAEGNWPQFRGPAGNGHCDATGLPLTWSETRNVTWKTPIHNRGWSSPVIWGNQIWMTTADKKGKKLFAVCVDRTTGKIVHDVKVFDVARPQRITPMNSYASPTPVIEAGRVYVHYGTYGTACLDTKTGRVLWARRDMKCDHHMGPGTSPIPWGKLLIVPVDGCDVQYVAALDRATGKTVWKTDRSVDYTKVSRYTRKAFCTPTVIESAGRRQLISPCSKAIIAYDPDTGKELWKVRHSGWSMVPRPLFGHNLVYLVMDYDYPELWALRADGRGDVTGTHIAWKLKKPVPGKPSFLLIDDLLFLVSDKGTAACLEAKTGRIVWQQRIGGQYSASPLYADGRIYLFSERDGTTVIEPARKYKLLATNRLDGRVMASCAVAGKALFLRTETHLYRIEKQACLPAGRSDNERRGEQNQKSSLSPFPGIR